jgi:type III secretion system low calcium response chaperone LcrH/SycD
MPNNHKQTAGINLGKIDFNNKALIERLAREVLQKMEENPGMTLKDATGISDAALGEMYRLAYTFYNQGKYRESIALFEFLVGAAPNTYKYILGLAASYHQIEAYNDAFAGFFIALHLDPENPIPAYYAIDCCLKQNWHEEAEEFAEATAEICGDRPEYAALKHRCNLIVQSLKSKK